MLRARGRFRNTNIQTGGGSSGRRIRARLAQGFTISAELLHGLAESLEAALGFGVDMTATLTRLRELVALQSFGFGMTATLDHASPITPGSSTFDSGSGNFTVPDFNTLTIELWGGGGPGTFGSGPTSGGNTTIASLGLSAGGGKPPTVTGANQQGAGPGGTAAGGNTENTNGTPGTSCSPNNASAGTSGKGGDTPHGGLGGASLNSTTVNTSGNPGQAPGGGGGGSSNYAVSSYNKYNGGGSGAYVKHVLMKGDIAVGTLLAWVVGAAGASGVPSQGGGGNGANGRVKFTWS